MRPSINTLQKSEKCQFFYWSSQTALGSGGCSLFDCRLSPCSKTWKRPYFRLFQPDTEYFLPLLPYTDLVPPSTEPVPHIDSPWTAKNWECCLGITDFCTVYPGSCLYYPHNELWLIKKHIFCNVFVWSYQTSWYGPPTFTKSYHYRKHLIRMDISC